MQTLSIKEAFKDGWSLFKGNKRTLVAATFVMMVASAFNRTPSRFFWEAGLSSLLIFVAIWIVNIILQIGWIKLLLKLIDGEVTSVKELIQHSGLFLKYIGAYAWFALGSTIGLILFIIPGFYWILKYGFAPIIVIDEHVSIKAAFKMSGDITKGVKWKLLGLLVLMILVNIAGAVVLFIGLFVSIPVSMLAYLSIYRKLINKTNIALE
jgi:uncharacterized membrane protein